MAGEAENIEIAVDVLADAIENGNAIYVFGDKHCGHFQRALYNETKGLALINPIWHASLTQSLMVNVNWDQGGLLGKIDSTDMVIMQSNLKEDSQFIKMAMFARELDVIVIVTTENMCSINLKLEKQALEEIQSKKVCMITLGGNAMYTTTIDIMINMLKNKLSSRQIALPKI
ncbi:MAG: SIS domain-containing protein [Cellulosilyticaceae bacterium]